MKHGSKNPETIYKEWFDVIGNFEALSSFANMYFNNPRWVLPGVYEKGFRIKAEAVGHPLIPQNERVCNDITLTREGDLGTHSILEVLYKEVTKGKSWRQLRSNVLPCRKCTYQYLCPPLSNYESAIGRNNLCHIWENGKQ